jgi:hypothetical protein
MPEQHRRGVEISVYAAPDRDDRFIVVQTDATLRAAEDMVKVTVCGLSAVHEYLTEVVAAWGGHVIGKIPFTPYRRHFVRYRQYFPQSITR